MIQQSYHGVQVGESDGDDSDTQSLDGVGSSGEQLCEELLDRVGFGRFHWMLFVIAGLGWSADVTVIFSGGLLIPVLKDEFEVGNGQVGLIGSCTFFGMLLGSWLFGSVGDVCGRKPAFFWTSLMTFVFGVVSSFASTFWEFLLCRFLVGFFLGGNLPIDFSLFLEWTPPATRERATIWLTGWSIIATFYASVLGSWTLRGDEPHWRLFIVLVSVLSGLTCLCRPYVPESPRFLICSGDVEECVAVLRRVARINKVDLPNELLDELRRRTVENEPQEERESWTVLLFKVRRLFEDFPFITTFLLLIWFSSGFGFYCFATWAPAMMDDLFDDSQFTYAVLTISTPFQFVSLWLAVYLTNRCGPAKTLAFYFTVNCLSILWFPIDPTKAGIFLAYTLFGMGSEGFFGILYLLTNLCYPTVIRTTGFGFCAAANRLAGMVAPFVAGIIYDRLKLNACILFGTFFGIAAVATLLLLFCVKKAQKQNSLF